MNDPDRSTHPRVSRWLENFPEYRRESAGLLVAGLKLVSETDLRCELDELVSELLQTLPGPVAAFPVREVGNGESAHGTGPEGGYDILEPGLPGSEAVIANILTGLARGRENRALMLDPLDLGTLRSRQVRTLLLVDDFSGSGDRIIAFDKALRRHPTIRSWASFQLIRFHVVAYAATGKAVKRLKRRFGEDYVHIGHASPTFAGAGWSPEQRTEIENLCFTYVAKGHKKKALGYGDSRALIAFEHTAPNNLPQIMWRTGKGWNSLFELKAVPRDLLRLFTMRPNPIREPLAGSAGAKRLGQVIDLLGHRVRSVHTIAEATKISMAETQRLLNLTRELGLTGPTFRLTDRGLVELRRWRSARSILELPNHNKPYYPRQLRAEQ